MIREIRGVKEIREVREVREFREVRDYGLSSLNSLNSLNSLILKLLRMHHYQQTWGVHITCWTPHLSYVTTIAYAKSSTSDASEALM